MENGVSDAETAFLVETCAQSHAPLAMATWMVPPRQFLREIYIFLGEEEAVRRHRAGMVAGLAPAERGGGCRLEADELGHESLGTIPLLPEYAEAEVWGPKAAPTRAKHVSCRTFQPASASGKWTHRRRGLAGMHSHFVGVQLEVSVVRSSLKACERGLCGLVVPAKHPVVEEESFHVSELLVASTCVRPSEMPPSRPRAGRWSRSVLTLLGSGSSLCAEQDKTVVRVARHRFSSLSCFWSLRLTAWTIASRPLLAPSSSCVGLKRQPARLSL